MRNLVGSNAEGNQVDYLKVFRILQRRKNHILVNSFRLKNCALQIKIYFEYPDRITDLSVLKVEWRYSKQFCKLNSSTKVFVKVKLI